MSEFVYRYQEAFENIACAVVVGPVADVVQVQPLLNPKNISHINDVSLAIRA